MLDSWFYAPSSARLDSTIGNRRQDAGREPSAPAAGRVSPPTTEHDERAARPTLYWDNGLDLLRHAVEEEADRVGIERGWALSSYLEAFNGELVAKYGGAAE